MDEIVYNWPLDFPENCPELEKCLPAQGKVFRMVDNVPPTELDFQITRIESPGKTFSSNKEIKQSYGVSVWAKLQKIIRTKKRYPAENQFGNKKIVSGELVDDLGVIAKEKNGHITLWLQIGAKPHLYINNEEAIE